MNELLVSHKEIQEALNTGRPIVALESTIISHGMPYPQNLEVATEIESIVRSAGAVPATIAILDGKFHVGLSGEQLEKFASTKNVMKCSRRDLPFVVAQKMNGATTVAATMIIAQMAGIRVFATGGIGGVHRNAENTFDVSADLIEFAHTGVAVVSAGAKAILDLPKTLEYLETFGVPVIGYKTDVFPAFYTRSSGLRLAMTMNDPGEIAAFMKTKWDMGLKGGILIANPIPEENQLNSSEIEIAINTAIQDATARGVSGKDLTPFLLGKLNEVTAGKSQDANKALVLNNARLAAEIAISYSKHQTSSSNPK